jgi:hypothetical protein
VNVHPFIEAEKRAGHSVKRACEPLKVSRAAFYARRSDTLSKRRRQDAELTERISLVHAGSRGAYGAPRVHAALRQTGTLCGRRRIARLMREAGLTGRCRRPRVRTTVPDPRAAHGPRLRALHQAEHPQVRRHHPHRERRGLALPGHRHRHRLPQGRRLGHRRPPANLPGQPRPSPPPARPESPSRDSSSTPTGAANTPAGNSRSSPVPRASACPSGGPESAGTTPSGSPASLPSSANSSPQTATCGPAEPQPVLRSSSTSRAGTTSAACTAAWAIAAPPTTRPPSLPDRHDHRVRQSGASSPGVGSTRRVGLRRRNSLVVLSRLAVPGRPAPSPGPSVGWADRLPGPRHSSRYRLGTQKLAQVTRRLPAAAAEPGIRWRQPFRPAGSAVGRPPPAGAFAGRRC